PGPVEERSDKFGQEAVALAGVIAALQQTSVAPSVSRAAADLSAGFIAPVADGRTPDLAGRQDAVMATVREAVAQQSKALSEAAAEILALPKVPERRYVPLTAADAVVQYAGQFIPSWAGAISIDLLPAVLVGIMAVVHAAMRRAEEEMTEADQVTAADMLRALELNSALATRRRALEEEQAAANDDGAGSPDIRTAAGENVTPFSERKRQDPCTTQSGERGMSVGHTTEHRGGRNLLVRYLSRFEEGRVIRAAFFGMLMGTVTVLGLDLKNLIEENGGLFPPAESSTAVTVPVLPPAVDSV